MAKYVVVVFFWELGSLVTEGENDVVKKEMLWIDDVYRYEKIRNEDCETGKM